MKESKEILEVYNYRMKATKYLEAVVLTGVARLEFNDKQHELGLVNLTDASKIPKEIISELYEQS